jgi:hypothetical protein
VTGIAAVFPGVPHRYCHNHFLRDLAKPTAELDSHAKVQMRSKVRGLRELEKQVLSQRASSSAANPVAPPDSAEAAVSKDTGGAAVPALAVVANDTGGTAAAPAAEAAVSKDTGGAAVPALAVVANDTGGTAAPAAAIANDTGGEVVLDYCAMVRGILNDDQGGPLRPPGVRMAEALTEVRASLQRNLEAKKGGPQRNA